ncbi:NTP transferase domain-containing protein [Aestuariivirga sp.]|uniref:phosphocholine cytidylyltransferase family protein n=1 Tax=Aestuariivirga sp. TaxID=2650926 RepID=UPI0039E501F2
MAISRAVILAAGRGTRLAGAGGALPKGLVDVGGEALVSRSIRQMQARGVSDIVIVTGYRADLYDAFAAGRDGLRCVHNPNFEYLGSLESLRCGLLAVKAPLLVLDSDILYEGRGLDALLAESCNNAALVSGPTGSGDEYYVWSGWEGRLRHFSKHLADLTVPPLGEHVGIIKLGPALRMALLEGIDAQLMAKPYEAYESHLMALLSVHRMTAAYVRDLAWSEIDTPEMFATARPVIWPRLKALGDL